PERILSICRLSKEEETRVRRHIDELGSQGYRVLGVCSAPFHGDVYPSDQDAFDWQFKGLLALYDPPKPEVREELARWLDAGIDVKLVTGDFPETARTIATLVGLPTTGAVLKGDDVMAMPPAALKIAARSTHLFTRMFPEAKLKLIDALKASGEIVAMMGDGVNDGPALRSAQIGIAMGGRGTEIARRAADLILTDDNLAKVTEAIRQGRKIYYNLKKAIRYIISIHVPIMIIASVPLLLNWKYPNVFTPIHIIFLELIMGPTCSVFFEKEPVESHIMEKRPRRHTGGIFTMKELAVSFLQGAAIAAGILIVYFHYMQTNHTLPYVRTLVFITLVTANVFLTFINRSFEHSMLTTFRYKNPLAWWLLAVSALFLVILVFFPPIQRVFGLVRLSGNDYLLCLLTAIGTTWWLDLYKILVKQHSLEIPTP
ncbi:MAG TPA: cation-translocating P-type ATPase, partial [Dinghuibacter sp.]|uniref:cation-translocating P-type ATPase n=1 Tax=Dinghuibacter sp. TaxID=2024697 RepID=UPI002C5124AE